MGGPSVVDATGFVLAGGQSSRMGEDKSLVQLGGRPLVAHALAILHEAGLSASIAGASSPLAEYAPLVEDLKPGQGPLGGVCAALASCVNRYAAFLSVDLPLLPASLVAFLLHHAQITGATATIVSVNGFAQTFPAVVDRRALPVLESALKEGDRGCFSAFRDSAKQLDLPLSILPVELLVQSGQVAHPEGMPAAYWFHNVNTRDELDRAEGLLSFRHRNGCIDAGPACEGMPLRG